MAFRYENEFREIWDSLGFGYRPYRWRGRMPLAAEAMQLSLSVVTRVLGRHLDADELPGVKVRDDARIFLAQNLHALVILPQMLALFSSRRDESFAEMHEALEIDCLLDARTVVDAARRNVSSDEEVTAAAMVRGLAEVLPDLQLKRVGLWAWKGDEPND